MEFALPHDTNRAAAMIEQTKAAARILSRGFSFFYHTMKIPEISGQAVRKRGEREKLLMPFGGTFTRPAELFVRPAQLLIRPAELLPILRSFSLVLWNFLFVLRNFRAVLLVLEGQKLRRS